MAGRSPPSGRRSRCRRGGSRTPSSAGSPERPRRGDRGHGRVDARGPRRGAAARPGRCGRAGSLAPSGDQSSGRRSPPGAPRGQVPALAGRASQTSARSRPGRVGRRRRAAVVPAGRERVRRRMLVPGPSHSSGPGSPRLGVHREEAVLEAGRAVGGREGDDRVRRRSGQDVRSPASSDGRSGGRGTRPSSPSRRHGSRTVVGRRDERDPPAVIG